MALKERQRLPVLRSNGRRLTESVQFEKGKGAQKECSATRAHDHLAHDALTAPTPRSVPALRLAPALLLLKRGIVRGGGRIRADGEVHDRRVWPHGSRGCRRWRGGRVGWE
jgi:hypothetical protein